MELEKGIDISLSVVHVDGLVLARSAFHHSMNYRSVVVFGKAQLVGDETKNAALKIISDHLIPGRWEEARKPNAKELKATKVLEISIDEASAKIRTGGPIDDDKDYKLDFIYLMEQYDCDAYQIGYITKGNGKAIIENIK